MSGRPFLLEGRIARVMERFASPDGIQSDALDIRFEDAHASGQVGTLGTTVGSLEQRIADGQVKFLWSATTFNAAHRWSNHVGDPASEYQAMALLKAMTSTRSKDHITPGGKISAGTASKSAVPAKRSQPMPPGRAALLFILASNRWTFVTELCDLLWAGWQPDWGVMPSYSTILRWVKEAQASPSAGSIDDLRRLK